MNNELSDDGDQMSTRGKWSTEANLESDRLMNSKITLLNIRGSNSRIVEKEVVQTFFSLTKDGPGKNISDVDTKELLDKNTDDMTLTYFISLIGNTVGKDKKIKQARFKVTDKITIPSGWWTPDSPAITTTVGRLIFNTFIFKASGISDKIDFVNEVVNKDKLNDIDDRIAHLLLEDHIVRDEFVKYINHRDTLGYWLNAVVAPSLTMKFVSPLPEIQAEKERLIKKYSKEIEEGDVVVMHKIESDLMKLAYDLLKDDPGMDLYSSGDLNFMNAYKNNNVLKGMTMNKNTGKFDFIPTSYIEGLRKQDIPAHANSVIAGQYPTSIATQDSGYIGKKLQALLQMIETDAIGTDCGTTKTVPILITKKNSSDLVYSYIVENGELVLLTPGIIGSYVGKRVNMRSPKMCTTHLICNKCAGELYYLMGTKHAGLLTTQLSHSMLNAALKSKHSGQVKLYKINPDTVIMPI